MNELFNIKDQVVVITGGTGVLGRCIAKYLAKEGAKVVIMGRKAEVGDKIVADIKAQGGEAMFLVTDVMDAAKVEENLQDILKAYGRVDALLNAAGGNMPGATIAPTGNFFDLDPEQFKRVLDLNLTGTVIPTQIFLRPMVEQGKGSIINFSSMAAFRPMTRVCGYAAAKAGIWNLLSLAAMLSVQLSIFNLIPFPALDGGWLIFLLIELITRRKVSDKIIQVANLVGISILFLLMILVTIKDILFPIAL